MTNHCLVLCKVVSIGIVVCQQGVIARRGCCTAWRSSSQGQRSREEPVPAEAGAFPYKFQ